MTNLVFVYGTLKKGFGNHHVLQGAEFVGEATLPDGKMLHLGAFPGLIPGNTRIFGEVYRTTPHILQRLDRLEGHPSFYMRSIQEVFLDSNHVAPAWCYFLSADSREHYSKLCPVIEEGIWNGRSA